VSDDYFRTLQIPLRQRRTIRLALGSRPREIAGLMLRQGVGWMVVGLAGGTFGTVLVLRLLRRFIDAVPPFDPISLGFAVAILVGCAIAALLIPVRRATRVDPIVALRVS
jgi:ABC-type antimicrobial peptide transport system permease subunit